MGMSIGTGAMVVGVLAMAYGLGFAVLPMDRWRAATRSRYTMWGAGLIGLLAFVLVVVPWVIRET